MPVHNHLFFSPMEELGRSLSALIERPSYLLRGDVLEMSLPRGAGDDSSHPGARPP